MSSERRFPLVLPRDPARSESMDGWLRSLAKLANLGRESRVLELGCSQGANSLLLAREFGASVVAADFDRKALDALRKRVEADDLSEQIQVAQLNGADLPFGEGEFNAVILYPKLLFSFASGVARLRRHLSPNGRLLIGYPVKVGRKSLPGLFELWEQDLGEPLRSPSELLQVLTVAGFEPELIDTTDQLPIGAIYEVVEAERLAHCPPDDPWARVIREEIDRHRGHDDAVSVSFALMVGRRKEPGERPALRRRI